MRSVILFHWSSLWDNSWISSREKWVDEFMKRSPDMLSCRCSHRIWKISREESSRRILPVSNPDGVKKNYLSPKVKNVSSVVLFGVGNLEKHTHLDAHIEVKMSKMLMITDRKFQKSTVGQTVNTKRDEVELSCTDPQHLFVCLTNTLRQGLTPDQNRESTQEL